MKVQSKHRMARAGRPIAGNYEAKGKRRKVQGYKTM